MWKIFLRVVAMIAAAVLTLPFWAGDGAVGQNTKPAEKVPYVERQKLVLQLGSPDEKTRDAATKALRKIGEEALGDLWFAVEDETVSKEARERARQLVVLIKVDAAEARTKYRVARDKRLGDRLAKETALGIDYFVGRMVRDCQKLTDDDWDLIGMMEERLKKEGVAACVKEFEILDYMSPLNWEKVTAKNYDHGNRILSLKCVGADSIKTNSVIGQCMFVCKKNIEPGPNRSISLIGKDARTRFGSVGYAVLLVNGNFETEAPIVDTVIIASGDVKVPVLTRVLVIAGGKINSRSPVKCVLREDARKVIDGIGFFSPELLGVELVGAGTDVEVRKLTDKSAFAEAGFKVGDRITAVNGEKVHSLAEFRELLRETVLLKNGEFSVTRGSEGMKKRIQFELAAKRGHPS